MPAPAATPAASAAWAVFVNGPQQTLKDPIKWDNELQDYVDLVVGGLTGALRSGVLSWADSVG